MKKIIRLAVAAAVAAAIVLAIVFVPERVDVPATSPAKAIYNYGGKNIEVVLTEEESREIAQIFRGRAYKRFEIPACMFSEFASIWFGDDYSYGFYPAFDGCSNVYDEELDEYFSISYFGHIKLHKILEKYGIEFS